MAPPKEKPAGEGAKVVPLYRPRKCVICGKQTARAYHPFCSKRCADIDLSKWLSGSYAIPAVEAEGKQDSEANDGES